MTALSPCPSCARHVRVIETLCPFCATAMPDASTIAPRPKQTRRLARAAVYAVGVASIAAAAGCTSTTGDSTTDMGGGADMHLADGASDTGVDLGGIDAAYGGAPDMGTDSPPPVDLGIDGPIAAYGAPPPDSGIQDAGVDLGGIGPLYGATPVDMGS